MSSLDNRIEEIVRLLEQEGALGERFKGPTGRDEVRFGTHGSLSVIVRGSSRGNWFDHEQDVGGGPWDLIKIRGGHDDVARWLSDHRIEDEDKPRPGNGGQIEATYDYIDEAGKLLFQVVRFPGHNFRQRRPDGKGGWIWDLKGVQRVLYHLPELIAAKKTGNGHPWRVYLCEGEKDADRLRKDWGVTATTNPGGAGNWRNEYDPCFAGAEIILLEDNDEAGCKRSASLAPKLARVGLVRVVRFTDLPEHGDISDWLDEGGSQSVLEDIIEGTEAFHSNGHDTGPDPWSGPFSGRGGGAAAWAHPEEPLVAYDLLHHLNDPPPRAWLVEDWIPIGKTTILSGAGSQGKTTLAYQLAVACALGPTSGGWLCQIVPQCKSALLLCEDDPDDVQWTLNAILRHHNLEAVGINGTVRFYPRANAEHNYLAIFDRDDDCHLTTFFWQFLKELKEFSPTLVVLDTRADLFRGNQNSEIHAREFIRQVCGRLIRELGGHVAIVLLAHPSRLGQKDGDMQSGSVQWVNTVRAMIALLPPDENEEDPDVRTLQLVKANFAQSDKEIKIRWDKGVYVVPTSTYSGPADEAAKLSKVEACIARLTKQGVRVTHHKAANKIMGESECHGLKHSEIDAAIRRLIETERLVVKPQGNTPCLFTV